MPPQVLPVSGCRGRACAAAGPETLCAEEEEGEERGGGGAAESHKQMLHPKEEQHASPGGHLFSQVCSPDVIKIGAAQPLRAALLPSRTKTVLAGARAREASKQLCRVFGFFFFYFLEQMELMMRSLTEEEKKERCDVGGKVSKSHSQQ